MSGRSSSNSQSKNETNTTDNRVGVEGGSAEIVQVVGGSNNPVTFTDFGAIAAGGELAQGALTAINEVLTVLAQGGDRLFDVTENSVSASLAALQQARDTEESGITDKALKLAVPIAAIVAVVFIFRRR